MCSTETALLRIKSDLLMSMDDQKIYSLLILLDLSGAFDTIDHLCLLQTLKTHFRINGKVLAWIESRAVVCRLFRKPVNLLQETVSYRLTFIQSSDLYFLSIHAILLELDHQCVHM